MLKILTILLLVSSLYGNLCWNEDKKEWIKFTWILDSQDLEFNSVDDEMSKMLTGFATKTTFWCRYYKKDEK